MKTIWVVSSGIFAVTAVVAGPLSWDLSSLQSGTQRVSSNTQVGWAALFGNSTGGYNNAVGFFSMYSNTTGLSNVAFGYATLANNVSGNENTAVGSDALYLNTASWNTAVGYGAMRANTTGYANAATGFQALYSNTTANFNTAIGNQALYSNTTGEGNTALGSGALISNTTASYNTALGRRVLRFNTIGTYNTGAGHEALFDNTSGSANTAFGSGSLGSNTTANDNTAVGYSTLAANTTGSENTAIGYGCLQSNVDGFNNVAIGFAALPLIDYSSNHNIAIGTNAGVSLFSNSINNILIDNSGMVGDSYTIRIGNNSSHNRAFISGIRGRQTANNNGVSVIIDSAGQLGTINSSRRYKEEIADMGDASARIQSLRPVTFRYKGAYADGDKPIQFGLIAEEVAETFPELAVFNDEGQPETVKYHDLVPMLLNEVQKQSRRAESKENEVKALQQELMTVKKQLTAQESYNQALDARLTRIEEATSPTARSKSLAKNGNQSSN